MDARVVKPPVVRAARLGEARARGREHRKLARGRRTREGGRRWGPTHEKRNRTHRPCANSAAEVGAVVFWAEARWAARAAVRAKERRMVLVLLFRDGDG